MSEKDYKIIEYEGMRGKGYVVFIKNDSDYCRIFCDGYLELPAVLTSPEEAIQYAEKMIKEIMVDKEKRAKGYPYISEEAIRMKEEGRIQEYIEWLENKIKIISRAYDSATDMSAGERFMARN